MLTRHNPSSCCHVTITKNGGKKEIYCGAEAKIEMNHISVVAQALEKRKGMGLVSQLCRRFFILFYFFDGYTTRLLVTLPFFNSNVCTDVINWKY